MWRNTRTSPGSGPNPWCRRFIAWPVRRQLVALAAILILPAVVIMVYSWREERQEAHREATLETLKLVEGIASEQQSLVAAAEQFAILLAQLPEVKAGHQARIQQILADTVRINPRFHDIALIAPSGRYLTSALPFPDYPSVAGRRFFRQAVSSLRFSSGDYAPDPRSGKTVLSFGYPVRGEDGRLSAVIAVSLDLNHFAQHLRRYRLAPDANYIIADYQGTIVTRGADNGQVVGKKMQPGILERMQAGPEQGSEVFRRQVDGDLRITSYRKLTLPGEATPYLYVRAGIPYASAMARSNREIGRNLLSFGLVSLVALLAVLFLGKRSIADRVATLQQAAREYAAGNLAHRVSDRVQGGELGGLAASFDEMARRLALRDGELTLQAQQLEREIEERQGVEATLLLERNNLQAIFESAPVAMALLDAQARVVAANRTMIEHVGPFRSGQGQVQVGEALHCRRNWSNPGNCGRGAECRDCPLNLAVSRALKTGVGMHGHEVPFQMVRDGVMRQLWLRFSVGVLQIDERPHLVLAFDEVTAQKEAEESLRAGMERLAVTLRSIGDGVITTDTNGNIVSVNTVAETLTGWSEAEAAGLPLEQVFRIVGGAQREPLENPVALVLASGASVELNDETILVTRNGEERVIGDLASPILDGAGKILGAVLVFRDTTEKRTIEEELFRARKLESIGVLAGGIAHDFNNYLTAILGNVSMAKLWAHPGERMHRALESAEAASLRARDLTQQLLTFSKGGAPVVRLASMSRIIRDSAGFVLRGSNVRCELSFAEELWPVEVDPGQMGQVINNLIMNADQALPEGGVIEIEAHNCELGEGNLSSLPAGRYLEISVTDHGVGIPEELLPRIFDPYFSTKEQGSGLGLATVYSIVKKHRGAIRVQSAAGETRFLLYLPASQRAADEPEPAGEGIPRGRGRVLVMDDEELIREVAQGMLELLGYQAQSCCDGAEACRIYQEARETGNGFDAVILDVTVPGGMGGKEAVSRLLAADPAAVVVVSSGYANDPVMAEYRQYGFRAHLAKPYNVAEVANLLKSLVSA